MQRIIVIGGGASGMTAAITAARNGAEVTVLEQNDRPGKKILSTGNGRCNLTNLQITEKCYRGMIRLLSDLYCPGFRSTMHSPCLKVLE